VLPLARDAHFALDDVGLDHRQMVVTIAINVPVHHRRAPFIVRREHDWSLRHRRLGFGPLTVMFTN